ncbi:MAG: AAA family ATPase [Candidatus Daviesbacteria bacterium]|nr:AAA family ATPase [Candidatus Daviesbacteria bacterium]
MEILLFTGYSASGKSTIAGEINKKLNFYYLGEREILHNLAVSLGYKRTREWLQHDGNEALLEAARAETIARIKEVDSKQGIILDGSYDHKLPSILKNTFPEARQLIICVALDDQMRKERMSVRLGESAEKAEEERDIIDDFKRKAGIGNIIRTADVTINNVVSLTELVITLNKKLEHLGIMK